MNDSNHEILPSPQPQAGVDSAEAGPKHAATRNTEHENVAAQAVEKPSQDGGSLPQSQHSAPDDNTRQLPTVQPVDQPVQSSQTASSTDDMPAIADDVDLIEKEWVHKAKQIVEHTKHDPYKQNKEIVRLRADYMKKRYNKEIKLLKD